MFLEVIEMLITIIIIIINFIMFIVIIINIIIYYTSFLVLTIRVKGHQYKSLHMHAIEGSAHNIMATAIILYYS